MIRFTKAIAIVVAFSASAALADTKPPAKPEAAPATKEQSCEMMKGMMRDRAQAQPGEAEKGKGGGMRCMPKDRSAANDEHRHDHPPAKIK